MLVELLLKARLRIGSPSEGTHGNFEFSAAKCADPDCRSGGQPFDDFKAALDHGPLFLRVWHSALLEYRGGEPNSRLPLPADHVNFVYQQNRYGP